MNQLCKVCGEPAAGFHFGAFTCEGCKSFFGRSYNNLSSISECKNNSECVINKKNRTACKACRLKKCLLVGMSKNGSRYGRRSNWFKIHCLLQEQQQQRDQQQQQHHQSKNPSDLMFLGLMDEYRNNRASLSSSSPSISSPDSHNSDSSVEIGEKRKINNIDAIKASAKMQNSPVPNMGSIPLSSHLASIFQLLPSPLGPLPLHLLPPPPLASPLYRPFHDYHHLYAQQHSFLSPTSLTPLANLPNNNLPDIVNNNLLNKSKTNDFYKKYYFNQIKKLNDTEDESESEPSLKSPSSAVNVTDLPSPIHSVSPHSPNYPIDLSMKADDLNNNKN